MSNTIEQSSQYFVNSLYWPEPTNGVSESDIEVKYSLGQAKSLAENSFKAGWNAANKQNNPLSKEQGEEWMRIMMSLVRVGYQHAATEIFSYCIENKVSPQFQDFIASMLNEENKKQFSYEMFADELKKMKGEPLPNSTPNDAVSDTTEADNSNADHQIKISELREKFFKECTENEFAFKYEPKLTKDPHDLFEWFKPYLKIPSIDWEGKELSFDVLQKVGRAREIIEGLIQKDVHEDIIEYMLTPLEEVLRKNGVNLKESDI